MRRDVPAGHRPAPPAATAAAGRWVLELPFTKPLSLNDRDHWRVKATRTATWRDAAGKLTRYAKIPKCTAITVELWYTPRDDGPRDPLNLVASLKACEDGLVDAGVIPDDSSRYHTSVMPQITRKGPERPNGNRLWLVVTAHA